MYIILLLNFSYPENQLISGRSLSLPGSAVKLPLTPSALRRHVVNGGAFKQNTDKDADANQVTMTQNWLTSGLFQIDITQLSDI
jgi:hypothetical protein